MKRPCLEPGCNTPTPAGAPCPNPRCPRSRRKRRAPGADRTNAERKRRETVVTSWVARHGHVCPGFKRPAHKVFPPDRLTADHVIPVSLGGPMNGPLEVLCNRCNASTGGRNRLKKEQG